MSNTPTLSTGQPSTLGVWRELVVGVFGEDNAAVAYFDDKIAEQGEHQPVLADERQVLHMITTLIYPESEAET